MSTKLTARKRALGPGTICMFVGLVAFGAYSYLSRPASAERQYFEADASGGLARVDRPNSPAEHEPPLWKPEPELLLKNKFELELSALQTKHIADIEGAWASTKADLERQIQSFAKPFEQSGKNRLSIAAATSGLAGYSELSREFGRKRASAWKAAVSVLDKHQTGLLEMLRKISEVHK